jgi:two-component system, LuxR family, sensor kinase FixL
MSWITVIWSMIVATCLTMALPHLLIWLTRRTEWVNLFFATAAVAVAGIAALELAMMHSQTAEEFGRRLQLAHLPVFVLVVAIVGFVRLYFGAGRWWLGGAACLTRLASLAINFALPPNLNFREITAVRRTEFFGELVSTPEGVANPWVRIGELSSVLLLAFVVDASLTLWRRGQSEDRRRAVIIGGSLTVFIVIAAGTSALIHWQGLETPYLVSFPFLAIIVAMGSDLSYDLLRSATLAQRLRESETALRESEDRMNLATRAAQLGLWVLNVQTNEVWMTEKSRELLGFDSTARLDYEALGARVYPDDRSLREAAINAAIETQGDYSMEYRVVLPDGTLRWISARGHCLCQEGKVTRLLGASMDVTAQKQAEAETRQHREELAHLSRVALMGEMAGSLAHELNQPLTGIMNNASAGRRFIARGRADFSTLDELLEAITADGRRAGEIIRAIRGMVQKGDEVRGPVQIGEVITSVQRIAGADALGRHCLLHAEANGDLPLVNADPVQLQQVLLNLIVNALDAMHETPNAERRVVIRAESERGERVRVSVRDFGIGLPATEPQRIFEQFFSTKRDGLGMGLAIARSIITSHGGELSAANADGGGACVSFSLPVLAKN